MLGPCEVLVDGRGPVPLGGVRQRALVAILALHANRVVSGDRLVDLLWGENPPAGPMHTVQVFVSRLRRALGPAGERLVTRQPGYVLELEPDELDAERYEQLYVRARAALAGGDAAGAAALLRDGEALWRGSPLSEFTYEPFAQATIARLEELHASCQEELIEAELALGHHAAIVPALEALVREQPFRERPRGQLMLALYRSGRQADALDAFQQTRRALLDELAVEPSGALRELESAILNQDPALLLPAVAEPPVEPAAPAVVARAREPAEPITDELIADAAVASDPAADAEPAPGEMMRKTVTVVVACLTATGSHDPELARERFASARRVAEVVVGRHGGVVVSAFGGEIVSVFGIPLVREDDALRALRAAEELVSEVPAGTGSAEPLAISLGVDTGEVVAEQPGDLFGAPLDGALQLARQAAGDAVLLTDATCQLAGHAVLTEELSGRRRLAGFAATGPYLPRHAGGPMIDREVESRVAQEAFEEAAVDGNAHLLTIVGEAGIGKSRLVHELTEQLGERAIVLSGRCLSYGDGVALWPLRQAFTEAAGGESRDLIRELVGEAPDADVVADVLAAALGLLESEAVAEQIPWAVRRALELLARERPVVLIIDDAHSALEPLLDLVEHLVDWVVAPMLVVCLVRPELLESRPHWGGGHHRMRSLVLGPLSDAHATQLMESQRGEAPLEVAVREQILKAAEGNPLFVEQLLASSSEDSRWQLSGEIPAGVRSLLAARLDRLGPGERAFIERAAVIGREFWPAAVVELLPEEARASAEQHLRVLVRRGLIRPERTSLAGEQELRFHHMLVRDVAYRGTPKALRGELHERFANWLTGRAAGFEQFVGYHLEQAFHCRREVGGDAAELGGLAARGAEALAAAGRRAVARGDANAGVALFERSVALAEAVDHRQPTVLLDLGSALLERGDFERARVTLEAALALASETDSENLVARVLIELSYLRALIDPAAKIAEIQSVADDAVAVFERSGDEDGLSRALLHIAEVHWTRSHCAEMEAVLERALRHADASGEPGRRSRIQRDLARATVIGPRPVQDGIVRCTSILERAGDDISLVAVAETMLAVLGAMTGDVDAARERYRAAGKPLADVGLTITAAVLKMYSAFIELLGGSPSFAIPELVEACTVLERVGERRRLATTAALLSRLLFADGRYDDARHFSQISEQTTSADDVVSLVISQGTLGQLAARAGDVEPAVGLLDGAVALAAKTDFLILHADALSERASVLALFDRDDDAARDREQAIALYERKGCTAALARARSAQTPALAREPVAAAPAVPELG
jgi:DNA-binding SARP family transcriptional activator